MKLVLLGCDDEALDLVRDALADGRHVLVAAYDVGDFEEHLRSLAPLARFDDDWESLLAGTVAEAVIVARGKLDPSAETGFSADERRADQLRKLTQAALPMLVVHPACEMIVAYEVEMIREASGGIIVPFFPGMMHQAFAALGRLARETTSPLGEPEQLIWQRQMIDRGRSAVLAQFARDAFHLARIVGTIGQVAATGPAGTEYRDPLGPRSKSLASLANLSVHLSGDRPFPARWLIGPVQDAPQATLTLVAAKGQAILHMPEDSQQPWLLEVHGQQQTRQEFAPCANNLKALELLNRDAQQVEAGGPSWIDACHALEAASAIDRSLETGRAVALFTQRPTEEQAFKGVMAVGGCLMLAVTLLGVVIVVLVEALQLELRRSPLWRLWPLYLVTPIVVFLLLQTLHIVAKGKRNKPSNARESHEQGNEAS